MAFIPLLVVIYSRIGALKIVNKTFTAKNNFK